MSGTSSSVAFGIPGSNTTNFGAVDWIDIVSIDSGDFIYAVMTGNVTAVGENPECEGRDAGTYPPNGIFGSSAFMAGMRLWGGAGNQNRSGDSLWIAGRPNSSQATLQAERDGGGTVCNPGGAGLSLSSAQTIAYEIHPMGEVTQSPAMTSPGDTITYTATSYWTWENTRWLWQPNDTTVTPKGTQWAFERCRNTMVCSHAPTKSGRMYFTGTIKGVTATVRAPISWVGTPADLPTPSLTLSCTPQTVVRGGTVTCTFDVGDTGPVDSISEVTWRFDADSSKIFPLDAPTIWGSQRLKVDSVHTDWVGQMVLGGDVTLTVSRGGKQASALTSITVTERTGTPWSEVPATLTTQDPFFYRLSDEWGFHGTHTVPPDTTTYGSDMFIGGVVLDSVADGGPNHGYAWIESSGLTSPWGIQISDWLYATGPEVIPYSGSLVNNWDHVLFAGDSSDIADYGTTEDFFNDVWEHEVLGHHGEATTALGSYLTCGNANALLERLAGGAALVTVPTIRDLVQEAAYAVATAKSHAYVYGFQEIYRNYSIRQSPWTIQLHDVDVQEMVSPLSDLNLCNLP